MTPIIKWAAVMLLMAAIALPVSGQVALVDNATYCVARSTVANLGQDIFTWTPETFAGFYYDIDKNIGTEQITFALTSIDAGMTTATLRDREDARGIIYRTTAQPKNFKFRTWGSYYKIGFLGEPYFAAYTGMIDSGETGIPYLYDKSKNRNLMTNSQLSKILIDSDAEMTFTSDSPLQLAEDYELVIVSINVNETKTTVELRKDGQVVDTKMIQPGIDGATMADMTYYYRKDLGDTQGIVTIGIHFKSLMHAANKDSAVVDGIFQISDIPTPIGFDQQYGIMSVRVVDPAALTITLDNKDNPISLSKNRVIQLMQNIYIETANQDATATDPLRYYLVAIYDCSAGKQS